MAVIESCAIYPIHLWQKRDQVASQPVSNRTSGWSWGRSLTFLEDICLGNWGGVRRWLARWLSHLRVASQPASQPPFCPDPFRPIWLLCTYRVSHYAKIIYSPVTAIQNCSLAIQPATSSGKSPFGISAPAGCVWPSVPDCCSLDHCSHPL